MQNNSKLNTIIVVGLVILIGVGLFIGIKNKPIPNDNVIPATNSPIVTYTDPKYNFTFDYDSTTPHEDNVRTGNPFSVDGLAYKSMYVCIRNGISYAGDSEQQKENGFFDLANCTYFKYGLGVNQTPTLDGTVQDRAYNDKWHPFGKNPEIKSLKISGQEARIVSMDLQNPNDITPIDGVWILIELPHEVSIDNGYTALFLTIDTTQSFVDQIVTSFKFGPQENEQALE